jgi:hypothetical protein
MFCPQCGVELGGEAKSCASCGWSASRKTLWITIGCILGGLFLICCGIGTWGFLRMKRVAEQVATPLQVLYCRVAVVNYAKAHDGTLPDNLQAAMQEPLEGKQGEQIKVQFDNSKMKNGEVPDIFGTALRYVKGADGAFEVRSAGKDKAFDTADDVFEKGKAGEDLDALKKQLDSRAQDEFKNALKDFGVDVKDKGHSKAPDAPPPPPPPAPPVEPAPAPPAPPPPSGPK